ncbi:MAG: hypothetical protein KC912_00300 [Proteobacteria bacterium]|nr:hypothetical protein [Pseudomonadota bacterium]
MRPLFPLLLAGCTSSLSNDVFLEDSRFLSALPNELTAGPPTAFDPLTGDAELLPAIREGVDAVDRLTLASRRAGVALRGALPDERSDVHRRWEAVAIILEGPSASVQAWSQADVILADGRVEWTLQISTERDGPWEPLATGWHETLEEGAHGGWNWNIGVESTYSGQTETGVYELAYRTDPVRDVTIDIRDDLLTPAALHVRLYDTGGFAFPATLDLTGAPIEGRIAALHTDTGGRADGTLGEDEAPFTSCWDEDGDAVYLGPEATLQGYGSEADCALESIPDA